MMAMFCDKDIEFLVALAAHEESFFYEIHADLANRLPNHSSTEITRIASAALHILAKYGLIQVGKRTLTYETVGKPVPLPPPEQLQDLSTWAWPNDTGSGLYWYVSTTGKAVPEQGIDAVSSGRASELMFHVLCSPNNSSKRTR